MFSDKVKEVTKKLYIFVTQINHELYLDRNGFKLHLDCIFLLAFVVALVKLVFLGDTAVFPEIINSTFASSKTAFEISLGLTGVLSLWLGIMKIGERGGVIQLFARLLSPLFSKLFPEIPKGHPVTGSIFMNLAANMLGLDNAATPLGLKAMEGLQELNPRKDTASNPMIMF